MSSILWVMPWVFFAHSWLKTALTLNPLAFICLLYNLIVIQTYFLARIFSTYIPPPNQMHTWTGKIRHFLSLQYFSSIMGIDSNYFVLQIWMWKFRKPPCIKNELTVWLLIVHIPIPLCCTACFLNLIWILWLSNVSRGVTSLNAWVI